MENSNSAKVPVTEIRKRILIFNLIMGIVLVADQLLKYYIRSGIELNSYRELAGKFLILTKVENTGAFLSLGDSLPRPLNLILLSVVPVFVLLFGIVYMLRAKQLSLWNLCGIAMVAGGGMGNIYDRINYGSVTDFLLMDFGLFRTGIFNLGDMAIMIGAACILIGSFRTEKSPNQEVIAEEKS